MASRYEESCELSCGLQHNLNCVMTSHTINGVQQDGTKTHLSSKYSKMWVTKDRVLLHGTVIPTYCLHGSDTI